jgi:membrane fusion protein, multidrug efflux system
MRRCDASCIGAAKGGLAVKRFLKRIVGFALAFATIWLVYFASTKQAQIKGIAGAVTGKRGPGGAAGDLPSPVLLGEAKVSDVPIFLEGVGTVKALNTVTVKALVEGKILKYNFNEGQFVKKGDVLAEIDPTPYQASLDQVVAKKQVDETQLATAQRDYDRYKSITSGVIAQKTIDTQEALVRQLKAQVASDAAAVASAQTVLDYTKVISPLTGRTGIRTIDAGNVSRTGDAGIVVVTQLQPITVQFTLPQQQLPQIAKAMAAGAVPADAMDGDNKIALDKGTVTVVDNQVDQTTGTIKMKAEFPNTALQLWPGQFVNVRILANTLQQVVVIPTPAIQRGPTGAYVFVATADNRVAQRPVTVGQQNDALSVTLTGVAAGEKVVTTGFGRLQDGARIVATPPTGGGGQNRPVASGAPSTDAGTNPAATPTPTAAAPTAAPEAGERGKRGDGKRRGDGEGRRAGTAEAKSDNPRPASTPQ